MEVGGLWLYILFVSHGVSSLDVFTRAEPINDWSLNFTSDSALKNITELGDYALANKTTDDNSQTSLNLNTTQAVPSSTQSTTTVPVVSTTPEVEPTFSYGTTTTPDPSLTEETTTTDEPITTTISSEDDDKTEVVGSVWNDWTKVFSVTFWKKRFSDSSYTMDLVLPIGIGIGFGCLLSLLFCLCRRMCVRRRRYTRKRFDNQSAKKGKGDQWMLLDRGHSSDDETV